MGAATKFLPEQAVAASAASADAIIYPAKTANPNERVWLVFTTDAAEDVRLVKGLGDIAGILYTANSGTVTDGPWLLASILNGEGPHFIHTTNAVTIQLTVVRDG